MTVEGHFVLVLLNSLVLPQIEEMVDQHQSPIFQTYKYYSSVCARRLEYCFMVTISIDILVSMTISCYKLPMLVYVNFFY